MSSSAAAPCPAFFGDGGACGQRIAAIDWSATLGPIAGWPHSLRATLALLLRSPVPMVLLWGPDGLMLYNDAYSVFAGGRHPGLLGQPVRQGWPEVAAFNDHVMQVGLAGGTLTYQDQELTLYRNGVPEQVWMDLSYSPVPGDDGVPAGVLAIVTETTGRVRAQRQADASEQMLRTAVEQMPIGVSLAAVPSGSLIHMNALGARLVGDDNMPADVDGYGRWGALHADGRPYAPTDYPLARAARQGETISREPMVYRRPDGRIIHLEVSAAPVLGADGRPVLAVCAFDDVTDRVVAEQQLRDSEARLRRAHDAGGIGSYEWNLPGGGGQQSDSMLRLIGLPPGTYTLKQILATVHPDDRGPVMATVAAIGRGADRLETDYRVVRPDGSVRWVRDIGQLERRPDGQPLRWVGVVQDVTEHSLAEARLRANEERLRLAQEAGGIGMWDWDIVRDEVVWSPAYRRIWGHGEDEPASFAAFIDRVDPDQRQAVIDSLAAAQAECRPWSAELRTTGADGQRRFIVSRGEYQAGRDGRAERMVGISFDITDRRRTEDALRRSEEQLRMSLAAGRMVAWEIDAPSGEMIRSTNADDVLGPGTSTEDIRARMPAEDASLAREAAERAFADPGSPYEIAFRYRHPDGRHLWMHNRGVVQLDAAGRARAHGVCMDVTAQKTAELALRQLNEDLEAEVQRRSEELLRAQDALRQSQKMEALGRLTGGVAHDFNNLLGAVVGSLDLVRRRADDPERVRRYADLALQAAEKGARLTGQLLAFSRAQRIEVKPVDLPQLVLGLRDLVKRTLGPMISVSIDVCPRAVAMTDPTQLELAILNLAINSRDAMPAGGRLAITCRLVAEGAPQVGDRHAEIAVTDTGTGMTPEVAARALDPFFTTKPLGEGTGLGLSQVYGIVRQSGGDVQIESQPGAGTTIRLLLPLSDRQAPADDRRPSDELHHEGGTIMVIDDDPCVRAMLGATLEELGFDVVLAPDGASGLARLATLAPRLLILDFAMPGMTGAEVASRVRALRPGLPILFCSGYADSAAIEAAAGAATPVLQKPFRTDDLVAHLGRLLGVGQPAVAAADLPA